MRSWILGLAAAIGITGSATAQEVKPAIVYDIGGKFDKSFNEGVFNGAEQFKKTTGVDFRDFEIKTDAEREQASRGVAGYTAVGLGRDRRAVENLRDRGVIRRPEDLGIDPRDATRNLLAARSMRDLVRASHGRYAPPKRFRNW